MSRTRFLHVGKHTIAGRAWSGTTPVTRVDISIDGGHTWQPTRLEPGASRWAWSRWSYHWHVDRPGTYQLLVRASDELTDQPTQQGWNLQGMANNMAHRVTVHAIPPREGQDQTTTP